MTQDERLVLLLSQLKQNKKLTVQAICEQFSISKDSARRDIVKLAASPGVMRVRGGAIWQPIQIESVAFNQKSLSKQKIAIAQLAATLLGDEDVIALDAGTTNLLISEQVSSKATIVTNSPDIIVASTKTGAQCHSLAGHFEPTQRALLGELTVESVKDYHFDIAFIGVCALSKEGLTSPSMQECAIKKALISRANKVVLACESNKLNHNHMFHVCDICEIDILVTDQDIDPSLIHHLEQQEVLVLTTSEEQSS